MPRLSVGSFYTTALSPRLLDKAAIVRLSVQPREALELTGVTLDKQMLSAIEALDDCTRSLYAAFSFTTAHSLKTCLAQLDELGLDAWGALDLVLCQEVLSKLELLDPAEVDAELSERLTAWTEGPGERLSECAQLLQTWSERGRANTIRH